MASLSNVVLPIIGTTTPARIKAAATALFSYGFRGTFHIAAKGKRVKIQRYGLSLLEADFEVLYDCINLCEAIANDVAIFMDSVETLYLELLETAECNKM